MLTIRAEQLRTLGEAREREFERRLLGHLRSAAERERILAPDEWLTRQIAVGMREGKNFGLKTERQFARFLEATCLRLGGVPEGHWPKPALAILMAYGAGEDGKVDRYCEWAERNRYGKR